MDEMKAHEAVEIMDKIDEIFEQSNIKFTFEEKQKILFDYLFDLWDGIEKGFE